MELREASFDLALQDSDYMQRNIFLAQQPSSHHQQQQQQQTAYSAACSTYAEVPAVICPPGVAIEEHFPRYQCFNLAFSASCFFGLGIILFYCPRDWLAYKNNTINIITLISRKIYSQLLIVDTSVPKTNCNFKG